MSDERKLVRVVPVAPSTESGITRTQGTKLFCGDVDISRGVTRIELICEVNDIWRAKIEMNIQPPIDLTALAVFHRPSKIERIRKIFRKFYGWLNQPI